MKKPYEKPAILRRESLAAITHGGPSVKIVSDARLKTDITRVGTSPNGLGLYEWRYVGQAETWRGVIAQEVLKTAPEAVKVEDNGFFSVDYAHLGIKMERVN